MMGDPTSTLTGALGMELTHAGPQGKGLVGRCKRFALYAEDGVVKALQANKGRGATGDSATRTPPPPSPRLPSPHLCSPPPSPQPLSPPPPPPSSPPPPPQVSEGPGPNGEEDPAGDDFPEASRGQRGGRRTPARPRRPSRHPVARAGRGRSFSAPPPPPPAAGVGAVVPPQPKTKPRSDPRVFRPQVRAQHAQGDQEAQPALQGRGLERARRQGRRRADRRAARIAAAAALCGPASLPRWSLPPSPAAAPRTRST